jgi:diguanylate cyclase (GGDEF)-like protein
MPQNPPLALIASGDEWLARSFESVLSANGYSVLRAYTPGQALDQARLARPDAILIDAGLRAAESGADLCATLNLDPYLAPAPPIILIISGPLSRPARLDALRAGAWEVVGLPLDTEALLPQLETFVRARVEANRFREEGLLDPLTGLYNMQGILRRVRELGATARRHRQPLACIVLGPTDEGPRVAPTGVVGDAAGVAAAEIDSPLTDFVRLLHGECRAGDFLGRLGRNEFVVLSPGTGPRGALALAQRVLDVADAGYLYGHDLVRAQMRAGLYAVADFATAAVQPIELLVRATMALRRSRSSLTTERVFPFDGGVLVGA